MEVSQGNYTGCLLAQRAAPGYFKMKTALNLPLTFARGSGLQAPPQAWISRRTAVIALVCCASSLSACTDRNKLAVATAPPATASTGPAVGAPPSKLSALEAQLASMRAVALPQLVEFQAPVTYAAAGAATSAKSPGRDAVKKVLDELRFKLGEPRYEPTDVFDQFVLQLRPDAVARIDEVGRLIEGINISPEAKLALHSVATAHDQKTGYVEALGAIARAKLALPQTLITECVSALLLSPDAGPQYADIALEFLTSQVDTELKLGAMTAKQRDADLLRYRKSAVLASLVHDAVGSALPNSYVYSLNPPSTPSGGGEPLGLYLRKLVADAWDDSSAVKVAAPAPKGEFETTAEYQARLDGAKPQHGAAGGASAMQADFAKRMAKLPRNVDWELRDLSYNADTASFTGAVTNPTTGTRIPARLSVPREIALEVKQDLNGRKLTAMYGSEIGKTLTIKGFLVAGENYATVAALAWDTKIPLDRAESDKFAVLWNAADRERRKQEQAQGDAVAAKAAAQQARDAAQAQADAPKRAARAQQVCSAKKYTPAVLFEQDPSEPNARSLDIYSPRSRALGELASNGQYSTVGFVLTPAGDCFMKALVEGSFGGTSYRANVYMLTKPD